MAAAAFLFKCAECVVNAVRIIHRFACGVSSRSVISSCAQLDSFSAGGCLGAGQRTWLYHLNVLGGFWGKLKGPWKAVFLLLPQFLLLSEVYTLSVTA